MKKPMLLILWLLTICTLNIGGILYAQEIDNKFAIIPELTGGQEGIDKVNEYINQVWQTGGQVMEKYNKLASGDTLSLPEKFAAGIFSRTTILDYITYLVRFLLQIGLVVGALMIIYAGYQYATNIFGGKSTQGNVAIKNAIIGVLVVIFSYAIIKLFTALFLGS